MKRRVMTALRWLVDDHWGGEFRMTGAEIVLGAAVGGVAILASLCVIGVVGTAIAVSATLSR